jgi:hypothetical protein
MTTESFTGDGTTAAFTVNSGYTLDSLLVTINGSLLKPTTDYTLTGTTLTFGVTPYIGDEIVVRELTGDGPTGPQGSIGTTGPQGEVGPTGPTGSIGLQGPTGASGIGLPFTVTTETFTGNGTATDYTINSGYTTDSLLVVVNGILLKPVTDYTLTGTTLSFTTAPVDGDEIIVREMLGDGPTGPQGPAGVGPTGAQGVQGIQGIQGTQGVAGPTGPAGQDGVIGVDGAQGPTGPTGAASTVAGPTGPQGVPGTSVNIKGEVATVGALPAGASTGDAYIVTADGNLYTWTGSSYLDVGQIVGPTGSQGVQGPTGAQGTQGPTGTQGTQGTQGPTGAQGTQGDVGPTGPQGVQGIQGVNGTIGVDGAQGPTGAQGATGPTGAASTVPGPTGPAGPPGPAGSGGGSGTYVPFSMVTQTFTGDSSTSAFTIDSGYTLDTLLVTVSGILLQPTSDYTLSGTTLTLSYAPDTGQSIVIREMLGGGAAGPTGPQGAPLPFTVTTQSFTGDNTTTDFTINSGYTTDTILVVVNGIVLKPVTDYSVSGTTLSFTTAPKTGQEIVVREMTGSQGIQGVTGPTGPQGAAGAASTVAGPTGPAGESGTAYVSDTAPVSPETGQLWLDSTTGELFIYTGTAWIIAAGATGAAGVAGPAGSAGPTGPAGAGSSISIEDEGTNLTTSATSINFVGSGVTATSSGGAVTVTVAASGGTTAARAIGYSLIFGG